MASDSFRFAKARGLCHPFSVRVALAFVLLACGACSSSSPSTVSAASCANDPRVEAFSVPLSAKGASGTNIVIQNATPTMVQEGMNDWTVSITDSNGAPVDGTVTIVAAMPDHGHDSPTPATITSKGNGAYEIDAINLVMSGVWAITISIASPTLNDSATFTFCID